MRNPEETARHQAQVLERMRGELARMMVRLWRIAADTPLWTAEDMAGKGAAHKGARWNHRRSG